MAYGDTLKTSSVKIADIKGVLDPLLFNYSYADTSSLVSTSSGTAVDMVVASANITGNMIVFIYAHASMSNSAGNTTNFGIFRDSTELVGMIRKDKYSDTTGESWTYSLSAIDVLPAPGSYSYKLKWSVGAGTGYSNYMGILIMTKPVN